MNKLIHQIWLGSKPIPRAFVTYAESWQRHFPDWEYKLWTDDDLPELLPQMMDTLAFDRNMNVGLRSDILRLEILRLYGGIYADTDFECLKKFDHLLRDGCFHYGDESQNRPANSLLAAPAGHGLPALMLGGISRHLQGVVPRGGPWDTVQNISGPDALHRALQAWVWLWHCDETIADPEGRDCGGRFGDVVCIRQAVWFPYHWEDKKAWHAAVARNEVASRYPAAVAAHHWAGSWF